MSGHDDRPVLHDEGDSSDAWAGLGLEYGTVRVVNVRAEWGVLARRLVDDVARALSTSAARVEHVGSTAVPGLVAKPIIDLAAGVGDARPEAVRQPLERLGYLYRGDAGERGGLVFVLEDRPRHRVAHVHVVEYGGSQWRRYLAFRDLLRSEASVRAAYARLKIGLARTFPNDRKAYTDAKEGPVRDLLELHGEAQ